MIVRIALAFGLLVTFLIPQTANAQWNRRQRVVTYQYQVQVPVYQVPAYSLRPRAPRYSFQQIQRRPQCQQVQYYYYTPQPYVQQQQQNFYRPMNSQLQSANLLTPTPRNTQYSSTPSVVTQPAINGINDASSLEPAKQASADTHSIEPTDVVLPMLDEPILDSNIEPASAEQIIDPILDAPAETAEKIGDSVLETIDENN